MSHRKTRCIFFLWITRFHPFYYKSFFLLCIFTLLVKKRIQFEISYIKGCGSLRVRLHFSKYRPPGKFSLRNIFINVNEYPPKLILQNRIGHSRYALRFNGISRSRTKPERFSFLPPCSWKLVFIPPFCTHDLGRDELSDKGSVHSDEIAFHRVCAPRTKRALSRSRAVRRPKLICAYRYNMILIYAAEKSDPF